MVCLCVDANGHFGGGGDGAADDSDEKERICRSYAVEGVSSPRTLFSPSTAG